MNNLKLLGCSFLSLLLLACQVQDTNTQPEEREFVPIYDPAPPVNSFESLLHHTGFSQLHLMMQRDGEKMMCAQPAYQVCFDRSKEMCEVETKNWVFTCLSDAKYRVPVVYDKTTRDNFMGAYGSCMINQHAISRPDEIQAISTCMIQAPIDETVAIKALVEGKNLYQPSE